MLEPHTRRVRQAVSSIVVAAFAIGQAPRAHAGAPAAEQTPGTTAPAQPEPAPTEGAPKSDAPQSGTPKSGAPSTGMPSGTPTEGTPTEGTPSEGTPSEGTPTEGTPTEGTPSDAPAKTPAPTKTVKSSPPPPKAEPAKDEDEDDEEPLPQRLPPMQTAGWWTLFAGFSIGTVAGVLAGLAEREEDRAVRLAVRYDLDTGAQPRYEDIRGDYEDTLRKGRAEANAAIALAVVGLGAAVAGLTVLIVAQTRDRKAQRARPPATARRVRVLGGGVQVRF